MNIYISDFLATLSQQFSSAYINDLHLDPSLAAAYFKISGSSIHRVVNNQKLTPHVSNLA